MTPRPVDDSAQPRAEPAAGDAVRDDAQEQLPLAGRPGFHARLLGRRAPPRLDVVGGSLDQHAPALAAGHVDLVDLERHLVVAAGDPGLQVLVQRAVPGGAEHDRPVVPLVVHRQHGRAEPALVSDAADPARRNQPQALGLVKFVIGGQPWLNLPGSPVGYHDRRGAATSIGPGMTFNPDGMDLRPCRPPAARRRGWLLELERSSGGSHASPRLPRSRAEGLGRSSLTRRSSTTATPSCGSTRPPSAGPTCTSSRATCPRCTRAGSWATRPSGPSGRSATACAASAPATGCSSPASAPADPASSAARPATGSAWRAAAGSSATRSTAPRPSTSACCTRTTPRSAFPTA